MCIRRLHIHWNESIYQRRCTRGKIPDEVNNLPDSLVKGKIIFYNRPMDPKKISTFSAYGSCVDQRYSGAIEAAKKGAIAVIVRSMNVRQDDFSHTGSMAYEEE